MVCEEMTAGQVFDTELRKLCAERTQDFIAASGNRGSYSRVDSYVRIIRGMLEESSVMYVGERLCIYDGRCYVPLEVKEMKEAVLNSLYDMGIGCSDIRRMGDTPFTVLSRKRAQPDRSKICFEDCIYDMDKADTLPFTPKIICTEKADYPMRSVQKPVLWEKFLSEVLPDDTARANLQEFFGMCYIDREKISIEKMAFLIGSGANGKSVVFDVMKHVMGKGGMSFLDPAQLTDPKFLTEIEGRRLNFAADTRKGASFDSALKALASSNEVHGWRMYQGSVVLRCPPLAFAFNETPRFRDISPAFFRRVLPIVFGVTIPPSRQDRRLAAKICATELPGVFNWIMQGRKRLLDNGGEFTPCKASDDQLADMRRQAVLAADPVTGWLSKNHFSITPTDDKCKPVAFSCAALSRQMGGILAPLAVKREFKTRGAKTGNNGRGGSVIFLYPIQSNNENTIIHGTN